MSISKIFSPNFVCLLTHEKYKTYQTGFSFGRLGHAPGVGLRGTVGGLGVKNFFISKFNQIWCVSYLHEWHMHRRYFLGPHPLGPWGGAKRSNIIKSELQSQFQRFLKPNFVYLLANEIYITYQTGFSFGRLGQAQGWDLGYRGGLGVKKFFFPKFNQILCVSYSHEWHNFLGPPPPPPPPPPRGLGKGQRVNYR